MPASPDPIQVVTCTPALAAWVDGVGEPAMKRLTMPNAHPTPAAANETFEIMAIVRAESRSPDELRGHRPATQPLRTELVVVMDIAPVTEPTPTPAIARPKPPQRSQGTTDDTDGDVDSSRTTPAVASE